MVYFEFSSCQAQARFQLDSQRPLCFSSKTAAPLWPHGANFLDALPYCTQFDEWRILDTAHPPSFRRESLQFLLMPPPPPLRPTPSRYTLQAIIFSHMFANVCRAQGSLQSVAARIKLRFDPNSLVPSFTCICTDH